MAPCAQPAASPRSRIAALDCARAVGVVAMVVGHTLDALLASSARAAPAAVLYWKARGLTAPVFLIVSGWAVITAVLRSGERGAAVPRGRLPRVLLLLALGYALRWPGWGRDLLFAGDAAVRAHLLAFDVLHTIAVCVLAASIVLALPWSRRERAGAFALGATLAVALAMRAPAPLAVDPRPLPGSPLAMALAQAAGGTSPFPLFPWSAYFFAGAVVGLLAGSADRRAFAWMGAAGGALVLATAFTGVGTMPPAHPALVAFRIGAVLVLLALASLVPAAAAARVAPLGRASLGVYAIHVPVVYGWSTWEGLAQRLGPSLSPGWAVLVALTVLAGSFALQRTGSAALRTAGGSARWAWERRGAALAAAGAAWRAVRRA